MERIYESQIFKEEVYGSVRMWVVEEGIRVEIEDGRDHTTWHISWESLEERRKDLGENRETGEG